MFWENTGIAAEPQQQASPFLARQRTAGRSGRASPCGHGPVPRRRVRSARESLGHLRADDCHGIVRDGFFVPVSAELSAPMRFVPLPPPTTPEVEELTQTVAGRLIAWLAAPSEEDHDYLDPDPAALMEAIFRSRESPRERGTSRRRVPLWREGTCLRPREVGHSPMRRLGGGGGEGRPGVMKCLSARIVRVLSRDARRVSCPFPTETESLPGAPSVD
jgi:hypothetical protein